MFKYTNTELLKDVDVYEYYKCDRFDYVCVCKANCKYYSFCTAKINGSIKALMGTVLTELKANPKKWAVQFLQSDDPSARLVANLIINDEIELYENEIH